LQYNFNYIAMEKKKLKKIQLIEEPKSEELLRAELEEALGGWNCGTYEDGWWSDTCTSFHNGICQDGRNVNFCGLYTF